MQRRLKYAETRNQNLIKDLDDQQTILKGREKELARLKDKLAGIEAFDPLPLDW